MQITPRTGHAIKRLNEKLEQYQKDEIQLSDDWENFREQLLKIINAFQCNWNNHITQGNKAKYCMQSTPENTEPTQI